MAENKKEIEICKNCGHTYGWHNDLGFCCKCSSFNKPCWENKTINQTIMVNEVAS